MRFSPLRTRLTAIVAGLALLTVAVLPRRVYSQAQVLLMGSYNNAVKAVTVTSAGALNVVLAGSSAIVRYASGTDYIAWVVDSSINALLKLTEATPSAPTAALNAVAAQSCTAGAHRFKVTEITAGGETAAGTASGSVTCDASHTTVALTSVATGSTRVTGRNVYATKAGGTTYFLVSASPVIANNSATTYTFNTADGSFTATTAPSTNTALDTVWTVNNLTGLLSGPLFTSAGLVTAGSYTTTGTYTGTGAGASVSAGGGFSAAAATFFAWSTRSAIASPANSVIQFLDNAGTTFSRLVLGANDATTSGASWTLTSGVLESKTGDGTAFTSIRGIFQTTGSGMTVANVGANSCGTSAATIAGNNNAGEVTVGATSGTQCRIAFTVTAATKWQCTANDETTAVLTRCVPVDTTHADLMGVFTAGDVITYIAMPR